MSEEATPGPDTSSSNNNAKTCFACGAAAAPGKKLLRCSGCLGVNFCDATCQKRAWPQHRAQCNRCKKLDVFVASPLVAACTFLPRVGSVPKMICHEVFKREVFGRELHLHLRKPGTFRTPVDFDVSGSRVGPSAAQLHNMAQNDGYLEAAVVGAMYGFHRAIQRYNNRHEMGPPAISRAASVSRSHDYMVLVHRGVKIVEYGIAMGSTCPDWTLVYHVGNKVIQLQDPNNHVWIYFRTERSDRLYLDVGSLPYGLGMMLNIIAYLPQGTSESEIARYTPTMGAPALVLDRSEAPTLMGQARSAYLADRQRIPVSGLAIDDEPEDAVRALLQQVRQAAAPRPRSPSPPPREEAEAPPEPPLAAAASSSKPRSPEEKLMGVVAAAAMVTVAVHQDAAAGPSGSGGSGKKGSGGGSTSSSSGVGAGRKHSAAAGGRGSGGGGSGGGAGGSGGGAGGSGGGAGGSGGGASGSSGGASRVQPNIHFLQDGSFEKHFKRAMQHFVCAFNNTYLVLEQETYKRYPASLDTVRAFAPWVELGGLPQPPP